MGKSSIKLSEKEQAAVDDAFKAIREIVGKHNLNIENVIGLIPARDMEDTAKQVKIKFAEETVNVMNMIAFD